LTGDIVQGLRRRLGNRGDIIEKRHQSYAHEVQLPNEICSLNRGALQTQLTVQRRE
jgi:hypothetical protein